MNAPKWLQDYYGDDFKTLNPEVVFDGRKVAVVKLFKPDAAPGFAKIGYVLVRKNGIHTGGAHRSLHEGLAAQPDLDRMKAIHKKEDA